MTDYFTKFRSRPFPIHHNHIVQENPILRLSNVFIQPYNALPDILDLLCCLVIGKVLLPHAMKAAEFTIPWLSRSPGPIRSQNIPSTFCSWNTSDYFHTTGPPFCKVTQSMCSWINTAIVVYIKNQGTLEETIWYTHWWKLTLQLHIPGVDSWQGNFLNCQSLLPLVDASFGCKELQAVKLLSKCVFVHSLTHFFLWTH